MGRIYFFYRKKGNELCKINRRPKESFFSSGDFEIEKISFCVGKSAKRFVFYKLKNDGYFGADLEGFT